ncbi:MAG TPA: hypothetical protein PLD12_04260 [Bacteroidales bacterium]|nr:hypothetical protein [Bacteroidales bacterium]HPO65194.1 hypothetical protein [Bacteroidales bacterium]
MKGHFVYFLRKAILWFVVIFLSTFFFYYVVNVRLSLMLYLTMGFSLSLFFYFTSAAFYALTIRLGSVAPTKFVNGYMMISIAKLLLYLLILLFCLFLFKAHLKTFLLIYALNYLLFTVIEVVLVTKSLKNLQKSQTKSK